MKPLCDKAVKVRECSFPPIFNHGIVAETGEISYHWIRARR
jgi:hypothetical protein